MAYKEYRNFPAKEFPPKRSYIYDLAGTYYRYEDHVNAIRYMNEALATPGIDPNDNGMTMYNTIGLSYKELKKYDSSMLYLDRAYETAQRIRDSGWIGILSGNIGELYYLQKNYKDAIIRLEESITLCLASNIKRNAVLGACRLAGIYLDQDNIPAAESWLNKLAPVRDGMSLWQGYTAAQRFYAVTARLYAAKGNMSMAYKYADYSLTAKDSAHAEQMEINRVKAAEKAEYVQHKLELSQVAHEKQTQFFIRNSLIIVIALLTLLGLLFINRQRLQKKKLVAELDAITSKLIKSGESPANGDEQITAVQKEEDLADEAEAFSKLENSSLLTNEQWEEFRKLFDKVHKGFLSNLKRKLPDLSQTDIRFIALTKLKLSSREMASMLGVSPSTICIYKFRLRKKLGLDKEGDIEDLLNKL
jgi:tetratricopeptide (TPR) repeat protein